MSKPPEFFTKLENQLTSAGDPLSPEKKLPKQSLADFADSMLGVPGKDTFGRIKLFAAKTRDTSARNKCVFDFERSLSTTSKCRFTLAELEDVVLNARTAGGEPDMPDVIVIDSETAITNNFMQQSYAAAVDMSRVELRLMAHIAAHGGSRMGDEYILHAPKTSEKIDLSKFDKHFNPKHTRPGYKRLPPFLRYFPLE